MAIPRKGSRLIEIDDRSLRWSVTYDRRHWSKGSVSPVRIVMEDADAGGQRLIAEFVGCRRDPDDPLRAPFTPAFVRRLAEAGFLKGWQPGQCGADVRLDQEECEACQKSG